MEAQNKNNFEQPLNASLLLKADSTISEEEINHLYESERGKDGRLVLVLDDDPTGIQTVHDIYVYMKWTEAILLEIFKNEDLAFIQTNSRSLPRGEAIEVTEQIMQIVLAASQKTGRAFTIISRSDSSLRGHYPAETDTINNCLKTQGITIDGEILCFFLSEAGRYTIGDTHYIQEGDTLIPAAQTEFAKDAVFGYHHSNLKQYIEEKTEGRIKAEEVRSIPLEWLRDKNTNRITEELMQLTGGAKMVVNCTSYNELKHVTVALKRAERAGKRFLFRSAASLVKIYGYISGQPLLQVEDILGETEQTSGAVLTVAGSYTRKTTAQLSRLLPEKEAVPIELKVEALLRRESREEEINRAVEALEQAMRAGRHPILYTSRQLVRSQKQEAEENLQIGQTVSDSLVQIVQRLSIRPKALIVKGGITSSDIAVKGLGMEKALILGQVRPSIPVVRAGEESRFPGLAYVIFPGNTGTEEDLLEVWKMLKQN